MASYTFAEIFPAFSRGSDAYSVGSAGLLQLVTANNPRIQYDPVGSFIKGLFIEPATTNIVPNPLLAQSPVGTVTNFTASNLTVSVAASDVQGMTGRTGITKITDTNIVSTGSLNRNNIAFTADGSFYVFRVAFKAAPKLDGNSAEIQSFLVNIAGSTGNVQSAQIAWDSTISKSTNLQSNCKIAVGSCDYFGLIKEANGWYSAWMAFPDTGGISYSYQIRAAHNSSVDPIVTNEVLLANAGGAVAAATGSVYLDWVQVQKRSVPYPSSWIIASKNAEVAEITGSRFTEFFPQDGNGTVSIGAYAPEWAHGTLSTTEGVVLSFNDGTANEEIRIARNGQTAVVRVVDGGVSQADIVVGAWPNGSVAKIAVSYQLNSIIVAVNGNTAIVDTSATIPTATKLSFGMSGIGTQHFASEIGYVRFYNAPQNAETVKNLTV